MSRTDLQVRFIIRLLIEDAMLSIPHCSVEIFGITASKANEGTMQGSFLMLDHSTNVEFELPVALTQLKSHVHRSTPA